MRDGDEGYWVRGIEGENGEERRGAQAGGRAPLNMIPH